MGQFSFQKGVCILVLFVSLRCFYVDASGADDEEKVIQGRVFIDGKSAIAKIDSDFVCATMDWWPPEKCDCGTCSWGHASLLNVQPLLCSVETIRNPGYPFLLTNQPLTRLSVRVASKVDNRSRHVVHLNNNNEVTLFLVFGQENSWMLIPIGALTCLPITSFVKLQFPLISDLINAYVNIIKGAFGIPVWQ